MKTNLLSSILLVVSLLVFSPSSFADGWPTNITGTWVTNANNFTGNLIIASQAPTGNCRTISGTIFGNPIQGFYCPFSGLFHFLHKNSKTNDTFQVYSGNLSQNVTGVPLMAGKFSDFGQPGEYSFFAQRAPK